MLGAKERGRFRRAFVNAQDLLDRAVILTVAEGSVRLPDRNTKIFAERAKTIRAREVRPAAAKVKIQTLGLVVQRLIDGVKARGRNQTKAGLRPQSLKISVSRNA